MNSIAQAISKQTLFTDNKLHLFPLAEKMNDTIVLYPILGRGHLVSMVELGKLILTHHPSFSINIFFFTPPITNTNGHVDPYVSPESTAHYFASVSAANPSITFHCFPAISLPSSNIPPQLLVAELAHLSNTHLHNALQAISQTSRIKAFVMDFFNHAAAEVTGKLNIPTYYYFTSGASLLALYLYMPTLHQNTSKGFKDPDMILSIPGLQPISPADMPDSLKDRESKRYELFLNIAAFMRKSDGIIVNTFEAIDRKAIEALTDGSCVPEGPTPPVFCIGPLISNQQGEGVEGNVCLSWLNLQPKRSVVFLCFGGFGRFSAEQVKEMAVGLERSGQRFLWVVRNPTPNEKREPSLDELLPNGFLDRTKGRGLVVKQWAPQGTILSHDSVGGFVTHCGWNSVLEAICAGVPMVAWPLYAEQRLNRVFVVKEIKVALALKESDDGFVSAAEVEDRIRELMDSEAGKEMRARMSSMRNNALAALGEGGSSGVAMNRLAELWEKS